MMSFFFFLQKVRAPGEHFCINASCCRSSELIVSVIFVCLLDTLRTPNNPTKYWFTQHKELGEAQDWLPYLESSV